ncbi:MAG: AAA family ATPase [Planctomycetaceae bacterium]|jgi:predicted ATPase|nr:AAA family ATPase [Planctomycetaceae bacterium]
MRSILGIRIKNYRILKDISLGSIFAPAMSIGQAAGLQSTGEPLTPITVVIGRNGYGKSTLCDALGFIVDCLKSNAEEACLLRGGFDRIISEGADRTLEFQIQYGNLLYTLCIRSDKYNVPFVYAETLSHVASEIGAEGSMNFFVQNGVGKVVRPHAAAEDIRLADTRRLVLATLGNLTDFPDIVAFRKFLDSWYLCYFSPEAARVPPLVSAQRHLSSRGDNLANVIAYWEREHTDLLNDLVNRVFLDVLGIRKIETFAAEDGRLLVRFYERGLTKPFYTSQMSDGTLKLIAYLLLLGDPVPPPLICFEEPENGLYHRLLSVFVDEIRGRTDTAAAAGKKKLAAHSCSPAQFFITTHQPYLVDSLQPNEVWILEKGEDAFAKIRRASDDPIVGNMVREGMPLGALWFSEYLDK